MMSTVQTRVRIPSDAQRFWEMRAKITIFYTVVVQNIENGKLPRHVDSIDAGLNRESQYVPRFFLSELRCLISYLIIQTF